jgi:hypothetical protein
LSLQWTRSFQKCSSPSSDLLVFPTPLIPSRADDPPITWYVRFMVFIQGSSHYSLMHDGKDSVFSFSSCTQCPHPADSHNLKKKKKNGWMNFQPSNKWGIWGSAVISSVFRFMSAFMKGSEGTEVIYCSLIF